MAPIMLEVQLFLRFNERFWDEQLVAKAILHARTERAKKHSKGLEAEMATFALDDDDSEGEQKSLNELVQYLFHML